MQNTRDLAPQEISKDMLDRWLTSLDSDLRQSYNHDLNRVSVKVDWMLMAEDFPCLAEFLLREPMAFEKTARDRLCQLWKDEMICVEQLRLWVVPENVPSALSAFASHHRGILKISGKIHGVESTIPEIWSRTVKCSDSSCREGSLPYVVLREDGPPLCRFCGVGTLLEDRTKRVLYDTRYLVVSCCEDTSFREHSQFRRGLLVKLRDDFCEREIHVGEDVTLTGVLVLNEFGSVKTGLSKLPGVGAVHHFIFEVMAVHRSIMRNKMAFFLGTSPSINVEKSIARTQGGQPCFQSASDQLNSFASLLAPSIPAFFKLKISLLLAAVSGNVDRAWLGREKIHLLCKGGHTETVSLLMHLMSEATHPIPVSWLNFTDAAAVLPRLVFEKNSSSQSWQISASQISLTHGGMCFVSNLASLKKPADAAALAMIMENQAMAIGRDAFSRSVPCKTSVVAIFNPDGPDLIFSASKEVCVLQNVGRHFDLVCDLHEREEMHFDNMLASTCFNECSQLEDEWSRRNTALKERLLVASLVDVSISTSAEKLLTAFFHTSRQALRSDLHGRNFYQLETLTRVAKAFAKLRISRICEVTDVVYAIAFTEETRAAKGLPTLLKFEVRPNDQENALLFHEDRGPAMEILWLRICRLCQIHGNAPEE